MPARQGSRGTSRVHVVKIGGSVATNKERPFSLRIRVLRSIMEQLAAAEEQGARFALVIGGGSFGHPVASIYRATQAPVAEAYSTITSVMLELALAVAELAREAGLRPVIHPPHSFCRPSGLKPNCSWSIVARDLEAGATPLAYGDVYLTPQGWEIVSGDELSVEMACSLRARSLIYVTDVDGILGPDGRVIERLSLGDAATEVAQLGTRGADVTGGALRKIWALRENMCPDLNEIWVVNGLAEGRLFRLLRGEPVVATLITP